MATLSRDYKAAEERRHDRVRLLDLLRGDAAPGENKASSASPRACYGHGWGFAWPNDCRIIYNRASARPDGKPWSERKKLVWWDDRAKEVDWPRTRRISTEESRPTIDQRKGEGTCGLEATSLSSLHPDGVGWLFVSSGLKDGPLPTHYEPLESPVLQSPVSQAARTHGRQERAARQSLCLRLGDPRFPYVLTTYRLTEHHTAGGMTRTLSHLAELQPELFTEVSPELAAEAGLRTWRVGHHHHACAALWKRA